MVDHWIWGQHLSLSYYGYPPMIAWVFRLLTTILGDAEWALEVGAQLVNLSVIALLYAIARHAYGRKAALSSLLVLCGMPYFTLGSVFLHISQPFMFFWLLTLYCWLRWVQTQDSRWLWGIGVAAGFGALSKYIMILFYGGMMLHFLLYRELRRNLVNWRIYVTGGLSLLIFSPDLIWNAQHEWSSYIHQLSRGTSGAEFGENTLLFSIGHLFLFSPLWLVISMSLLYLNRNRLWNARSSESAITLVSMVPLVFFTLTSLKGSIADPHWANLSYLGLAILIGKGLNESPFAPFRNKLLAIGIGFNLVCILLALWHVQSPLSDWEFYQVKNFVHLEEQGVSRTILERLQKEDKSAESRNDYQQYLKETLDQDEYERWSSIILKSAHDISWGRSASVLGWNETAKQFQELLNNSGTSSLRFVVSREYQLSSALSYWTSLRPRPWPHSLENPLRNQWSPEEEVRTGPSVFVCELWDCEQSREAFRERFSLNLLYLGEIDVHRKSRMIRNLLVYRIE